MLKKKEGFIIFSIILLIFVMIITIISIVFGSLFMVLDEFEEQSEKYISEEMTEKINQDEIINIQSVDAKIGASELILKSGETFSVKTNNSYIDVDIKETTLCIDEKEHNTFNFNSPTPSVEVTLPSSYEIKDLKLKLGAGKCKINDINITDNSNIQTGAGSLTISNSALKNLSLELGVGETIFDGYLYGNSNIKSGIGSLDINLKGSKDLYNFNIENGIGSLNIQGEKIRGNYKYSAGENSINIKGGIGSINISFSEN